MKSYESLGFFDFEDFVEELTDEQLFAINGGSCAGGAPSGGHGPTGGGSCGGGYNPTSTPHYGGSCGGGGAVTPSNPVPTTSCNGGYNPPKLPNNDRVDDYTNPETWLIVYDTDRTVIRVYNTDPETFKMALNDPYEMAKQLKENYKNEAGCDFPVSTGSLAAEIYMHAALYSSNFNKSHTDIADCGANDSERHIYDLLAQSKGWK